MSPGYQAHRFRAVNGSQITNYSQHYTGWYTSNGSWSTASFHYLDFGTISWGTYCARR